MLKLYNEWLNLMAAEKNKNPLSNDENAFSNSNDNSNSNSFDSWIESHLWKPERGDNLLSQNTINDFGISRNRRRARKKKQRLRNLRLNGSFKKRKSNHRKNSFKSSLYL